MNTNSKKMPVCLTIAGLDPSGGAGIIADIKTFTAFGCFATAAVSSLTFQNTTAVFGAINQTSESIRGQIEPVLQDFAVSAVKTGMLPTREVIAETARLIKEFNLKSLVVDPVIRSTSGCYLIDDKALNSLIYKLFPLAEIITPNIPEAEMITKMKIESEKDIKQSAKLMQSMGVKNVLIKGGHLPIWDLGFGIADLPKNEGQRTKNKGRKAKDFLFIGDDLHIFEGEYYETTATHGTGCTLAAAITANLALGKALIKSVDIAKKFVNEAIRTAPDIGHGHSPINHSGMKRFY